MNIALIVQQRIFASIRNHLERAPLFASLLAPIDRTTSKVMPCRVPYGTPAAPIFVATYPVSVGVTDKNHFKNSPRALRVLRVVEKGQSASSVGRMVISGRMADVCAELDRLASRETALI